MEPIERHGGADDSPISLDSVPALRFVEPPPGVKKLTHVEGTLYLYSTVKTTDLKIPFADKGKPVKQDDVTATIAEAGANDATGPFAPWAPELMQVNLDVDAPALPGAAKRGVGRDPSVRLEVVVVGKDGTRRRGMEAPGPWMGGKPDRHAYWLLPTDFDAAPPDPKAAKFEPDYVLLTVRRGGSADKKLPFVFENVPVP